MKEEKIFIPVKIIKQGKNQLAVKFPAKIVKSLDIDSEKDEFIFILNKKKLHLEGVLVSKQQKNGKKN